MPRSLSQNEIILNMLDLIRLSQPDASCAPGSVFRDICIEAPSAQIALLYESIGSISNLQSLRYISGADLDNFLSNYGVSRKKSTKASGVALFTFSALPATVAINAGDLVFANNGASFTVVTGTAVNPNNANSYKSIATKYKNDLDFLNITDSYAVEITVQATSPGKSGNIAKYSLSSTNTPSVSHVANVFAFQGASDQEDDTSFRNRGLAIFSGSSTGTALGYRNTALTNSSVLDALVIEPGDPLMTRDGTISVKQIDGTYKIISEGTGNKVDIIVLGSSLTGNTDSFIYQDKSNSGDPTNSKNLFTLGQIPGDEGKTINRRRIDDFANSILPSQPAENIVEVSGSLSGSNFVEKTVDIYGRVSGNYELIKDTGNFAGSPFALDKFAWTSDRISLFTEDRIKSKFNGQDNLTFTDVIQIPNIQQNVSITNENSIVYSGDRSIVQLLHTPSTNVTRIFNVNTGERYTILDQNVDGDSSVNTTGRVRVSGNTLPSSSDVLQVDYQWVVDFDCYSDYDGKIIDSNIRNADDSIDWGLSNAIRNESVVFVRNADGAFYTGYVSHPVSVIASANLFSQSNSVVAFVSTGNFSGRLAVNLTSIPYAVDTVSNITLQNSTLEIFKTVDNDGIFINQRVLIGNQIRYNCQIILPTDTPSEVGDNVSVFYNQNDVFTVNGTLGNFNANQITIPTTNITPTDSSLVMRVNYFANVQDALTQSIINFPISRDGNSFALNSNTGFVNSSVSNATVREAQTVQLNGSNQLSIPLDIPTGNFLLNSSQIVSVIGISSRKEIWNNIHPGSIDATGPTYNLILSGYNSPAVGDNVIVVYSATDIQRTQPFTFSNSIIRKSIQQIKRNTSTNTLYVDLNILTSDTISFNIVDPSTNLVVGSGTGTLTASGSSGSISSSSLDFTTVDEFQFKKIVITNSNFPNNVGSYDVASLNTTTNVASFVLNINNINSNQVSIVRLVDNKELWNSSTIDLTNNRFVLPANANASENDYVFVSLFVSNNLRQAPSKLSITVSDQINNTGIVSVAGNTLSRVADVVFTATSNGLKQNVAEAMRKSLKLASSGSIPSNLSLSRLVTLRKVTTANDGAVLSTDFEYDVLGAAINDNIFYANELIDDDSLSKLEFRLPATINNSANLPVIGDKLQATFYYSNPSDTESVAFTRNGTLFTNKKFAFIDRIFISSGFSSTSAQFTFSYFNQPITGSRYSVYYDYTAPKPNERIIISYNTNKLIGDVSFDIESARPVNADVLVKAAQGLLVDITMNVVISSDYSSSSAIVLQNLQDRLTSAINTNKLADTLDGSDLVTVAQSVDGVDRARVVYFNQNGAEGQVLSIIADRNQYFIANNVSVAQENR